METKLFALSLLLVAQAWCGIPPAYQTNITVYHVNQDTFGAAPVNMDTGDALGDMYFDFRSVDLPIECRVPSPSTSHDCENAEVVSDNLVITKLILTVDSRFGDYGRCNVCVNGTDHHGHNNCTDGAYICGCGDYHSVKPCGKPVGRENITQHFSQGDCQKGDPNYDCWRGNVARKMGGVWYSTTEQGWCDGPNQPSGCTWYVAEAVKRVNKSCSDNLIYSRVEHAGTDCFSQCSGLGPRRNTTEDCWIQCFYDTVLGPGTDKPGGKIAGMPLHQLLDGWDAPFLSDGPEGCASLPIPHQAHKIRAWPLPI